MPKIRHRLSLPSWTHLTPAGFPFGIPGIGLLIDGAMQHAPQLSRQFIASLQGNSWLAIRHALLGPVMEGAMQHAPD